VEAKLYEALRDVVETYRRESGVMCHNVFFHWNSLEECVDVKAETSKFVCERIKQSRK
jgi:hypothetical protein